VKYPVYNSVGQLKTFFWMNLHLIRDTHSQIVLDG